MLTTRSFLSRRAVLAGCLAGAATPVLARGPNRSLIPPPRPGGAHESFGMRPLGGAALGSLDDMISASGVSGNTALVAMDAQSGTLIEDLRPGLRLPPASIAKTLTALYGLRHLGHEHRYATRVLIRGGSVQNGRLSGDLVLQGSGDPTLQTEHLAGLADQLISQGLREVTGRFLVDGHALPTLQHIYANQPVAAGYNPALSGLNLNFNRVHFAWETGSGQTTLSMDARSNTEIPAVTRIRMAASNRDLPVYTHDWGADSERWTVAASALNRSGSRWLPVRLPALYAGDVLRALLAARGCRIPAPEVAREPTSGAVLAEHRSGTMTSIVRDMLRYSTNITAECVGLSATLRAGHSVTALEPSAQDMNRWIERTYGASDMGLVDHSGLNDASRISVRGMAQFMRGALAEGILPNVLRDHAMRDAQGRPDPRHPVQVAAKTGSLNFVSSLVGYATPHGARPIVFAIVSADMDRRRAITEADGERPSGTRQWARDARILQQRLIERWSVMNV